MKSERKRAIDRADEYFSKCVRLYYSQNNSVRCVTCGKWTHILNIDCGHYMSRRHLNTRWTFENCGPQESQCNYFHSGEQQKMADWLDQTHGKGTAERMKIKALAKGQRFTATDIRFIADYWKREFNKLVKEKGSPWKN